MTLLFFHVLLKKIVFIYLTCLFCLFVQMTHAKLTLNLVILAENEISIFLLLSIKRLLFMVLSSSPDLTDTCSLVLLFVGIKIFVLASEG